MSHNIVSHEQAAHMCRALSRAAREQGALATARQLAVAAMLCNRWSANLHYTGPQEDPTNLVVVNPQTRSHHTWGRYLNRILVYTRPQMRSVRLARALDQQVCAHYAEQGLSRVRTLSITPDDYALHRAYGWTAWALDRNGHIAHDAPLHPTLDHPGVPPYAASLGATRPLHNHEVQAALTAPQGPYVGT